MKIHVQRKEEKANSSELKLRFLGEPEDQLLGVTLNGEEHTLYFTGGDETSLSFSSESYWDVGTKMTMRIDVPGEPTIELEVFQRTQDKSKLWFYEAMFEEEPTSELLAQLKGLMSNFGRQHFRYQVSTLFEANVQLGPKTWPIEDMSSGGFAFSALDALEIGDSFRAKLLVDGQGLETRAVVKNKTDGFHGYTRYGCAFSEIEANDSERLREYIYARGGQ